MDRDVPGEPLVLHTLAGRLRVHVPGWSAQDGPRLEGRLLRLRGVTHAQASPLTGNILVLYDPGATHPDALLAVLRGACAARARRGRRSLRFVRRLAKRLLDSRCPGVLPIDRFAVRADLTPVPYAGLRLLAALLGLGLVALRRLDLWRRALPVAGPLALALEALALLQRLPVVRNLLGRFLGRHLAELVGQIADAAALLLSGSPVSLALAGTAALLQLSGTIGAPQPIAV